MTIFALQNINHKTTTFYHWKKFTHDNRVRVLFYKKILFCYYKYLMGKYFGILKTAKILRREWKAKLGLARNFHRRTLERKVFLRCKFYRKNLIVAKMKVFNFRIANAWRKFAAGVNVARARRCYRQSQDLKIAAKLKNSMTNRAFHGWKDFYIRTKRNFRRIVKIQTRNKFANYKRIFAALKNYKFVKASIDRANEQKSRSYLSYINKKLLFVCFYALDKNLYNKVLGYRKKMILRTKRKVFIGIKWLADHTSLLEHLLYEFRVRKFRKIFLAFRRQVKKSIELRG